eukprot:TRINITY_DN1787_c0_g1_i1.p1 TRINITY_DN1787_c0_g1~~TRINITY_DN1787_c0_g1_i1.p1  ORF type:complete len:1197 (-),score=326.46 TRINITY_DN1787_c0_g1_i1:1605-5195(-)
MEEAHAVDVESAALLSSIGDHTEALDPDVSDFIDAVKSNYAFVNQCKALVRFVSPSATPRERFEAFLLLPTLIGVNSDDLSAFVPNVRGITPGASTSAAQFARRFGSPSILATILSSVNYNPIENFARITAIKCTPTEGERYFEPAALSPEELRTVIEYFVTDKTKMLLEDAEDFRGRRVASLTTFVAPESTPLERIRSLMSDVDILKTTEKKKAAPNLFTILRETILSCLQSSINQKTRPGTNHLFLLEKERAKDLHGELINAAFAVVVFEKSLGAANEDAQISGFFGYEDFDSLVAFANTVIDMAPDELTGQYPDGHIYGGGAQLPRMGVRKNTIRAAAASSTATQDSPPVASKLKKRKAVDTDSSSTGPAGASDVAPSETQPAVTEPSATLLEAPPSPKRAKTAETPEEDAAVDGIAALSDAATGSGEETPAAATVPPATTEGDDNEGAKDSMDVDLSAASALVGVRASQDEEDQEGADVEGTVDEEEDTEFVGPAAKKKRGRPRRLSGPSSASAGKSASPDPERPRRANAGFKKLDTSFVLPNTFRRAAASKALESMSAFVANDEKFEQSLVTRLTRSDRKSLLVEEQQLNPRKQAETPAPPPPSGRYMRSSVIVLPNKKYGSKAEAQRAYMKAYREQRQKGLPPPPQDDDDNDGDDVEDEDEQDFVPEPEPEQEREPEPAKSPTRSSQRLAQPQDQSSSAQSPPATRKQAATAKPPAAPTAAPAQASPPAPAPVKAPAKVGAKQSAPSPVAAQILPSASAQPPTQPQRSTQTHAPSIPQNVKSSPADTRVAAAPAHPSKAPTDPVDDAVKALILFFQTTCSSAQIPYDIALLDKSARALVAEGVTREGLLLSVIDAQTASGLAAFLNQKKVVDVVVRALVIQRFGEAGKMHFSVKIESTSADVVTQCVTEFETFFKKSIESEGRVFDGAMSTASRLFAEAVFKKFQVIGPRDLVEQLELDCIDMQELKDLGLNRRLLQLLQKEVQIVQNAAAAASSTNPVPTEHPSAATSVKPASVTEETDWTKSMKAMLSQTLTDPPKDENDGTHPHSSADEIEKDPGSNLGEFPFPADAEGSGMDDDEEEEDDEDVRRDLMESVEEVKRGGRPKKAASSSVVKAARQRQRAKNKRQEQRSGGRDPTKRRRGRPRKVDIAAQLAAEPAPVPTEPTNAPAASESTPSIDAEAVPPAESSTV